LCPPPPLLLPGRQLEGQHETLHLAEEGVAVKVPVGAQLIQSPAGHLYHVVWGQDPDTGGCWAATLLLRMQALVLHVQRGPEVPPVSGGAVQQQRSSSTATAGPYRRHACCTDTRQCWWH
jgi:hypothetical protein